jgi:hypothetical protein
MIRSDNFSRAIEDLRRQIIHYDGKVVDSGHWQGVSTEGRPDLMTVEFMNAGFTCPMIDYRQPIIPKSHDALLDQLKDQIDPNLPWADEHFEERVSRIPSNPGEAYKTWPWWRGQKDDTMVEGIFTHTYQERFWPKQAGQKWAFKTMPPTQGIRYEFGDLDDLVSLLLREPHTRQAYLPIFFPEDTGAVHGGRVPCTLGYQFLMREHHLHMWYFIRSCDWVRHLRDDIYLAARLLLWVLFECRMHSEEWTTVEPGDFTFICPSLHYHRGDGHLIKG